MKYYKNREWWKNNDWIYENTDFSPEGIEKADRKLRTAVTLIDRDMKKTKPSARKFMDYGERMRYLKRAAPWGKPRNRDDL